MLLGSDEPLKPALCYVVYFPMLWSDNPYGLLMDIKKVLLSDGMILMVTLGPESIQPFQEAWDMHHMGDMIYQRTQMHCVLDVCDVSSDRPLWLDQLGVSDRIEIVMAQIWPMSSRRNEVLLQDLVRF